ncbi:MAG: 16S rRNA (cytidine(1402)-2'-O)-methyltransferase [Verrucomicrobiota bacterium]
MQGENASLTPEPGHLYVVATPIGNLADLSQRALSILEKVDCIACEDTRNTGLLISRIFEEKRPLIAYHDHNEKKIASPLVDRIESGESIALVSDAGTPAISDPGFRLVRECRKRGIPVVPVPGACAFTTLLSASGLPSSSVLFVGFLPPKSAARKRFLEENKELKHTIALYESCHRIEKFLKEIVEILGPEREICIGRELTKKFETILTGPSSEVNAKLSNSSKKGEFVVLIAPIDFKL